jgi:uncharacterized repeat protein (TIGR03943 family)
MTTRLYRSLQALLLLLLGLFLGSRLWSGQITWYINTRFLPLTLLGSIGLLILARALFFERGRPPDGLPDHASGHAPADGGGQPHGPPSGATPWGLLVFLLPLVIGLVVPHRPLGSEALANRGLSAIAPLRAGGGDQPLQLALAPAERTILDWVRAFNLAEDPAAEEGLPADVVGFAYHDPRLPAGQVLLGRFALTCCVADAMAIGLIVEGEGVDAMTDNSWYRVQGSIYLAGLDGQPIPLIRAEQIEEVPMPEQPYLYN